MTYPRITFETVLTLAVGAIFIVQNITLSVKIAKLKHAMLHILAVETHRAAANDDAKCPNVVQIASFITEMHHKQLKEMD